MLVPVGPSSDVPSGSHAHTPVTPVNPVTPVTPVVPPPLMPSAAVEALQSELGQLDYYEGPDSGIMNAQTVAAIRYLQRDAHLPQTGQMNSATQAALATFLQNGDNHMGS